MMIDQGECITEKRKRALLSRLNRIKGQIQGLQKMVTEGRYCLDILTQISSVHEALRGVGKMVMRNYLEVCATQAIESKEPTKQEKIYDELMDIIYKYSK
jgi:DNA-binding FrmR family transcriptional regulator